MIKYCMQLQNYIKGRGVKLRQKKDDKLTQILQKIAPGTPIRDGLENILKARTGALLLFTDN